MFAQRKRLEDHETRIAALALAVAELRHAIATTSPAALRNRIDELQADIDSYRAANRKELGSLWKRVGLERGGRAAEDVPTNDELQALIDFQRQGSSN